MISFFPYAAQLSSTAVPLLSVALCACGGSSSRTEVDASPSEDAGSNSETAIISAYYGLDQLPVGVGVICGPAAVGEDGMPVTFSVRLSDSTVSPEAFAVETATGEVVTPVCATLQPANEPLEQRTVLLAGPFGTPDAQPRAVEVVGQLEDVSGNSLRDLSTDTITPLEAGPSVLLAERFDPNTAGLSGECPAGTEQVVQLTWDGGVTGPNGAALGDEQRTSVSVTLSNDQQLSPVALADDDPDNIVLVCLDTTTVARSVTVQAGQFHDPGDDPNLETSVAVVPGVP